MKSFSQDGRSISEDTIKKILEVYGTKRWHEIALNRPEKSYIGFKPSQVLPTYDLCKLGKELMTSVSKKYVSIVCKNDCEERWLHMSAEDPFLNKESKKSPTFSDKVDSMVVLIHNNCVFNWKMFSQLLNYVRSGKIRVKSTCIELIYTAFMEVLPMRKLRYFDQLDVDVLNFLGSKLFLFSKDPKRSWDELDFVSLNLLLAVSFEDFLKSVYSSYIQELSDMMNRGVEFLQKNASNLVLQMLIQKPEHEEILLDLIISRLNHKDNKMSSYTFKMLDTLLLNHEKMKKIVVKKVMNQVNSLTLKLQNDMVRSLTMGGLDKVDREKEGKGEHSKENGKEGKRVRRRRMKKRKLNYISTDMVHVLKSVYRCILYVSKLQYKRDDGDLVNLVLDNNIKVLLMFISRPSDSIDNKSKHNSSKNKNNINNSTNNVFNKINEYGNSDESKNKNKKFNINGLYKYEECSRIIKILLLFVNKLLNYYKKSNKYEEKKRLLVDSKLPENLYNLSYQTKSVSINILVLVLLQHLDLNKVEYHNLLYNNIFNLKLYESTNVYKFLILIQQIFQNNVNDNSVMAHKLLQMTLCNHNNNINNVIVNIILKSVENKGDLWELYLYYSTHNPHLLTTLGSTNSLNNHISNLNINSSSTNNLTNKRNRREMELKSRNGKVVLNGEKEASSLVDLNVNSLYNELSIISCCAQPEYTLERYWKKKDRMCELYQRPFQLYYESRANLYGSTKEDLKDKKVKDNDLNDRVGNDEDEEDSDDFEITDDEIDDLDGTDDSEDVDEEDEEYDSEEEELDSEESGYDEEGESSE